MEGEGSSFVEARSNSLLNKDLGRILGRTLAPPRSPGTAPIVAPLGRPPRIVPLGPKDVDEFGLGEAEVEEGGVEGKGEVG